MQKYAPRTLAWLQLYFPSRNFLVYVLDKLEKSDSGVRFPMIELTLTLWIQLAPKKQSKPSL